MTELRTDSSSIRMLQLLHLDECLLLLCSAFAAAGGGFAWSTAKKNPVDNTRFRSAMFCNVILDKREIFRTAVRSRAACTEQRYLAGDYLDGGDFVSYRTVVLCLQRHVSYLVGSGPNLGTNLH